MSTNPMTPTPSAPTEERERLIDALDHGAAALRALASRDDDQGYPESAAESRSHAAALEDEITAIIARTRAAAPPTTNIADISSSVVVERPGERETLRELLAKWHARGKTLRERGETDGELDEWYAGMIVGVRECARELAAALSTGEPATQEPRDKVTVPRFVWESMTRHHRETATQETEAVSCGALVYAAWNEGHEAGQAEAADGQPRLWQDSRARESVYGDHGAAPPEGRAEATAGELVERLRTEADFWEQNEWAVQAVDLLREAADALAALQSREAERISRMMDSSPVLPTNLPTIGGTEARYREALKRVREYLEGVVPPNKPDGRWMLSLVNRALEGE